MLSLAIPDGKALESIQELEKKMGKTLLAFNQWQPAELDEEEVKAVRDLEKKTCYTLIAVKGGHE